MIKDLLDGKSFKNLPIIETDKKGRITYFNDNTTGKRYSKKYDDKGNLLGLENSEGENQLLKYTIQGLKSYQNINGNEQRYKYDSKGKIKKTRDNNGVVKQYRYDRKGNICYSMEQAKDFVLETTVIYDRWNNMISKVLSNGQWEKWVYDKGFLKEYSSSDGDYYRRQYYKKSRMEEIYDADGLVEAKLYDKGGKVIKTWTKDYEFIKEGEVFLERIGDEYVLNGVKLIEND